MISAPSGQRSWTVFELPVLRIRPHATELHHNYPSQRIRGTSDYKLLSWGCDVHADFISIGHVTSPFPSREEVVGFQMLSGYNTFDDAGADQERLGSPRSGSTAGTRVASSSGLPSPHPKFLLAADGAQARRGWPSVFQGDLLQIGGLGP